MYRQGDVLFIEVSEVEGMPIARENGVIVVARGESTGHAHTITAPEVQWIEGTNVQYLNSNVPFQVEHQEHDTLMLPAGKYVVIYQYEMPAPDFVRQVRD